MLSQCWVLLGVKGVYQLYHFQQFYVHLQFHKIYHHWNQLAKAFFIPLLRLLILFLERTLNFASYELVRFLSNFINDDTICFVRNGYQEFVLSCLNSFHNSIQFTYEIEKENEISFIHIFIIRSGQKIETRVYRKSINTDICYLQNSCAPSS